MCGLAGFWAPRGASEEHLLAPLRAMVHSLAHRGPDEAGTWWHGGLGVGFGHRRLAVLELSPLGRQPMLSACGRFALVLNGEIYNHVRLRRELEGEGERFRGHSDTEVMLRAFMRWGVERAVVRFAGMFAFAFLDVAAAELWLGRDRLGEKPLYYGTVGNAFVFASEARAFAHWPGWSPRLNAEAVAGYFRRSYVPTPLSIYEGVHKLPPAHLLRQPLRPGAEPTLRPYWSLSEAIGTRSPAAAFPRAELATRLHSLLLEVVAEQRSADVPVGAFLSGGIDSSLVVSLLQESGAREVRSFSIGFEHPLFDESVYAREVANRLGTRHTELVVSDADARRAVLKLGDIYDEPFADSSQLATYLVAELARASVTVALSGDGGDEIFAGYNRHLIAASRWRHLRRIPGGLRHPLARAWRRTSPEWRARVVGRIAPRLSIQGTPQLADKLDKLALLLEADSEEDLYDALTATLGGGERVLRDPRPAPVGVTAPEGIPPLLRMQFLDAAAYLPDDILVKVDRASMAVALEVRAPFLDHRVVDFAWRLPPDWRVGAGQGKLPLRELLATRLPASVLDRPKAGFAIPIDAWLRGPLKDWAEALLHDRRLDEEGWLDGPTLRALWASFLRRESRAHYVLWNALLFQSWLRAQGPQGRFGPQAVRSWSHASASPS